jgi:hypothetical protein
MNPLVDMPVNHTPEREATRIVTSQNTLFDLVEREVKRLAAKAPQAGFKHQRVEGPYTSSTPLLYNKVELTVECSCSLNLDLEVNRPSGDLVSEVQCKMGIFQKSRHQKEENIIEDHLFIPNITAQGVVLWRHKNGTDYSPQQLCEFAFRRFFSILHSHEPSFAISTGF